MISRAVCMANESGTSEQLQIGEFQSRAIWNYGKTSAKKAPVVILIPGSGPLGPEAMMDGKITADGKDYSLSGGFAKPLNDAGVHTLALGKPGVEFFSGWESEKRFYDLKLLANLHWRGYLDNVLEAIQYVSKRPEVDPDRIYLLGHSEGTQVAIDVVAIHAKIRGLILLGFWGENPATTLDWQFFRRPIDELVKIDVDVDRDGFVSREEATKWPEVQHTWRSGQEKVSYKELEDELRADPNAQAALTAIKALPLYQEGVFDREPLYNLAASISQDLYVYTGALDIQTPADQALKLKETCVAAGKKNCPPKSPRYQRLLDATVGPVSPAFQEILMELGNHL